MHVERFRSRLDTPFGPMHIAVDHDGVLVEVWLPNRGACAISHGVFPDDAAAGTRKAVVQLNEYFAGERRVFDLNIAAHGARFEQDVWAQLRTIPYGVTTSYGAIASTLGLVNGARAVGRANGANPIPIIIPCHRVIGMDGQLTGFGGGLPLKQSLLELEGAVPPPAPTLF